MNHLMNALPDPLPVPVTQARAGDWKIDTFTLTEDDIFMNNLRAIRDNNIELLVKPGTYTRLFHRLRGVVMSNTPMEVSTNAEFVRRATGRVMINGLGLGMVLRAVLDKKDVESVVVNEVDPDVITMVMPGFERDILDGRLSIHQRDCFAYKPARGERYNVIWHDVWDDISAGNLEQMNMLKRRWAKRCDWQGCWSEQMDRRLNRRAR